MDSDKSLQVTNQDFLIYRDSNNEVKISVLVINNDITRKSNKKSLGRI